MNKKNLVIVLIVIVAVLLAVAVLSLGKKELQTGIDANPGIKRCPEKMVVNEMPGPDRSGESDTNVSPARSSYYMLENKRYEVDEFNTAWVAANCYVPTESVN